MKVLLYLKEKQLEFTSHYVDLVRFEQHEPWFVAINPNGQVPVLVHDGKVVTESSIIGEYLEDVFSNQPLRPEDPHARARMRIIVKFIDDYALPALSVIGWHRMLRRVATSIDADEFERLMTRVPLKEQETKWRTIAGESFAQETLDDCFRKLAVAAERLERELADGPWLAGTGYSLADINAYTLAATLPELVPDAANEERTSKLLDWLDRMDARPAVQAALAMPNMVPETLRTFSPTASRAERHAAGAAIPSPGRSNSSA
jgi:glutathione S-transferase